MRALIIDDEELNRAVLTAMLTTAEVQVDEASGGAEALRLLEQGSTYDIVLVDLRMPGVDGFQVVASMRARDDEMANVPIVIITADHGEGLQERSRRAGADELLLKPVKMDELFEAIGRLISRRPQVSV